MKNNNILAISAILSCFAFACADSGGGIEESCTPGCKDGILTACDGNKAMTTPCQYGCDASNKLCKEPGGINSPDVVACTSGCKDGVLTICSNNVPAKKQCSNGCNDKGTDCKDNASVELCTPGCEDGILTTCYGSTPSKSPCTKGCKDDNSCKDNECTPSCKDKILARCDGTAIECPNGCNTAGDDCQLGGGEGCEYATKCGDNNTLLTCDSLLGNHTYNCADYEQQCTVIDGVADCRSLCATVGEKMTKCDQGTMTGSYTLEYNCEKATDGKLYWKRDDKTEKACESGQSCDAGHTKCVDAQTCEYQKTEASCQNNTAVTCIASGTIQSADCTSHGKTCVRTSSTVAECVDKELASCSKAGETKKVCGVGETTMTDVSTTYTCKKDADGNLRYLDGTNELCGNAGCEASTGECKKEDGEVGTDCTVSAFKQRCSANSAGVGLAIYCSEKTNKVDSMACSDPGESCHVMHTTTPGNVADSDGNIADCFKSGKKCSTKGETKTESDNDFVYTIECAEAEDGSLFWVDVNYAPIQFLLIWFARLSACGRYAVLLSRYCPSGNTRLFFWLCLTFEDIKITRFSIYVFWQLRFKQIRL